MAHAEQVGPEDFVSIRRDAEGRRHRVPGYDTAPDAILDGMDEEAPIVVTATEVKAAKFLVARNKRIGRPSPWSLVRIAEAEPPSQDRKVSMQVAVRELLAHLNSDATPTPEALR